MCGFTRLIYGECGYDCNKVSDTLEHTLLCDYAKLVHLVEGIDRAPAVCALSDDTEPILVAEHVIFGYCDKHRMEISAKGIIERGDLDEVRQAHAHVDAGSYCDDEKIQLQKLGDFVQQEIDEGTHAANTLEAFLTSNPQTLRLIENEQLRSGLSRCGMQKHGVMFLDALQQCAQQVLILENMISQRVSNKTFVEMFEMVYDKAKKTEPILVNFRKFVECLLGYEHSRPAEHFNGSEARLSYYGDLLVRLINGTGPENPPPGFEFLNEKFQIPTEIAQNLEAIEAVRQAYLDEPMERAEQKYSRKQAGTLNIHRLCFDPKGLGNMQPDEPAKDIEWVHNAIPDTSQDTKVDVEGDQGNKLVWIEYGQPHIEYAVIVAQMESSTPLPYRDELSRLRKVGQSRPREGYGLYSSDEESDAEEDDDKGEKSTKTTLIESGLLATPLAIPVIEPDDLPAGDGAQHSYKDKECSDTALPNNDRQPSPSPHQAAESSPASSVLPSSSPLSVAAGPVPPFSSPLPTSPSLVNRR